MPEENKLYEGIDKIIEDRRVLLEACKYLEKALLVMEKFQSLPVPEILRNNIECLQQAIRQAEEP